MYMTHNKYKYWIFKKYPPDFSHYKIKDQFTNLTHTSFTRFLDCI